ncbi:MAG TPA: PrsW family intramembrane metalloprotease [Candidatus Agrococcus pullicola]|uniref:PrsW family intramembrane metalloprotease n=1 Tax=Candidatus Agrococcus pullicola TaxID=2838429 RepID=A0A9D1YUI1_9MICO|nr:PrsW family intramembrane metalloprotease [Candidatus Agrococcus pullicola]
MSVPNTNITLPSVRHTQASQRRNLILTIVFLAALALATPVVVFILALSTEFSPVVQMFTSVIALVPLAFVVWVLHIMGRWEPVPLLIKLSSALWGGIGAVLMTLGIGLVLEFMLVGLGVITTEEGLAFYGTVIQAPIVEELAKAIPLLFLFLFMRKQIDGPIDGMVIAGLSAAGFAYTENILYFSSQVLLTGDASGIFVMRGIMSPLTHAIFTAMGFGLLMGLVAHRSRIWALAMFPAGWAVSAFLHMLWNGSALLLGNLFYVGYFVIQVPIAVGSALVVVFLTRSEAKTTKKRLSEYAEAGWLSLEEAHRLSNTDGRAQLLEWAKRRGVRSVMTKYIQAATRLAFNRQRTVVGGGYRENQGQEADSLTYFSSLRQELLRASSGDMTMGQPGAALRQPPSLH